MADAVLYSQTGHVVTLTLNRPDALNPLSDPDMIDGLVAACARIDADSSVRCSIITGAGHAFSAGGNVKHMRERTDMFAGPPDRIAQAYRDGIHRVPRAVYALRTPLIAAVNGAAVGAALDVVCMADIRLAAATASFGTGFIKIGIGPGDGAAWFLPRAVGESKAAELLLTGRTMDADEALRCGLVSRVLTGADLMPAALDIAERIARHPPLAVQASKRLLRESVHQSLEAHLEACAAANADLHHTADHHEALAAFFERRPGTYRAE